MRVLGISAFYHDSAAALIEHGRIVEPPRRKSVLHAGSMTLIFRPKPSAIAWNMGAGTWKYYIKKDWIFGRAGPL